MLHRDERIDRCGDPPGVLDLWHGRRLDGLKSPMIGFELSWKQFVVPRQTLIDPRAQYVNLTLAQTRPFAGHDLVRDLPFNDMNEPALAALADFDQWFAGRLPQEFGA